MAIGAGRSHAEQIAYSLDVAEGVVKYANLVWDTNTLAWMMMTRASGGGGGGAVTIANGDDVAQGATTDLDTANTVIGRLKKIVSLLSGTLATDPIDRAARDLGRVRLWDGTDVALVNTDGSVNVKAESQAYGLRFEDAGSSILYIGEASPGTTTATAGWRIQKINTTSGVVIQFADGDTNFDNVWDNRGSLSYS